jgi:hypothetical protein
MGGMMRKPYHVYVALGDAPAQFRAAYATKAKAEQAVAFWITQRGAVSNESFRAYVKEVF